MTPLPPRSAALEHVVGLTGPLTPVGRDEFWTAAIVGAAVAVAVVAGSRRFRTQGALIRSWAPALVLGAATLATGPGWYTAGLWVLGAAQLAARWAPRPELLTLTSPILATLLWRADGTFAVSDARWVAVALTTMALGLLLARADAHRPSGQVGALLPLTMYGVAFTVPDTEVVFAALGATVPLLGLGAVSRLRLGPAGSAMAGGVVAWHALVSGSGRTSATIGAIGSLGVLFVAGVRSRPDHPGTRPALHLFATGAIQVSAVAVASRGVGLIADARVAALAGAATLLATYALVAIVDSSAASEGARPPTGAGGS